MRLADGAQLNEVLLTVSQARPGVVVKVRAGAIRTNLPADTARARRSGASPTARRSRANTTRCSISTFVGCRERLEGGQRACNLWAACTTHKPAGGDDQNAHLRGERGETHASPAQARVLDGFGASYAERVRWMRGTPGR